MRRTPSPLGPLAASACLVLCCCSGEEKGVAIEQTTRLTDLLELAEIRSPLTEITAARDVAALVEPRRETVHREDFEAGLPAWSTHSGSQLAATADRGRALVVSGLPPATSQEGAVVPVEPNTHYVFERLAKSAARPLVDFMVIEGRSHGGKRIRRIQTESKFRKHAPLPSEASEDWQRGSVSFVTTPKTDCVRISLAPKRLRAETKHAKAGDVFFDELRLYRVEPTPLQRMSLLKGRSLAPGADAALGIHKRDRFLPLGELGPRYGPRWENYSVRDALYAPPLTELAFPVRVERDAVLRFSPALWRETAPGDAALFEVLARSGDREDQLWSKALFATDGDWRWHEASIDLSPLRGRAVELVFRTHAVTGSPHPLWGNPIVDVPPDEGEPRNVILIAVDTLRADRLSCYGYGKKTSPNLDSLAADGVRFDQVASNANWTPPSFASIFTGVTPARHGVATWGARSPLPGDVETLAEMFSAAGWVTHSIIYKMALYQGGFDRGFDVAFNIPVRDIRADDNLAAALDWLEEHASRRNFLFLHFNDPHQPFNQPEPFVRTFADPAEQGLQMPVNWKTSKETVEDERMQGAQDVMRGLYDGAVAYVDDRIGALVEELKRRGLYDEAVIAFVSDHGEELWEHGRFGHGGEKLHDVVVRVPMIVKPSRGAFAAGKVVDAQVSGFDVMPTLLELAKLTVPDGLDASSLVPLFATGAPEPRDRVAIIDARDRGSIAVRTGAWKYILRYASRRRVHEFLYDLRRDPAEQKEVAASNVPVVREMRSHALDYVLANTSATFLVVVGEESANESEHVVRGISAAQVFFGGAAVPIEGKGMGIIVRGPGPIAAAFEIDAEGPVYVGEGNAALERHVYRRGDLARLVSEEAQGIHLFVGRARSHTAPVDLQSEDLEQLEAMRALGYVGDQDDKDARDRKEGKDSKDGKR